MKHTHPNLPYDVEIYNTGVTSNHGGYHYNFHLVREPIIIMNMCKNLKTDEEAVKYFDNVYNDKSWCEALMYLYVRATEEKP